MDELNATESAKPEPKMLQPGELGLIITRAFQATSENMLALARGQEALQETLKKIIEERSEIVSMMTRLSDQVKVCVQLQDSDHAAVEMLMAIQGTPKDTDVN